MCRLRPVGHGVLGRQPTQDRSKGELRMVWAPIPPKLALKLTDSTSPHRNRRDAAPGSATVYAAIGIDTGQTAGTRKRVVEVRPCRPQGQVI